jgi:hypothetical protein
MQPMCRESRRIRPGRPCAVARLPGRDGCVTGKRGQKSSKKFLISRQRALQSPFASPCGAPRNGLRWEIARSGSLPIRTWTMRRIPPWASRIAHPLTPPVFFSPAQASVMLGAVPPRPRPGGKNSVRLARSLPPRQRPTHPQPWLSSFLASPAHQKRGPITQLPPKNVLPIFPARSLLSGLPNSVWNDQRVLKICLGTR